MSVEFRCHRSEGVVQLGLNSEVRKGGAIINNKVSECEEEY